MGSSQYNYVKNNQKTSTGTYPGIPVTPILIKSQQASCSDCNSATTECLKRKCIKQISFNYADETKGMSTASYPAAACQSIAASEQQMLTVLCNPTAGTNAPAGVYAPYVGVCQYNAPAVYGLFQEACTEFTSGYTQADYMKVALNKVAYAIAGKSKKTVYPQNILGIMMYTANTNNFNALNAAKGYYSKLGDIGSLKQVFGVFPTEINAGVWSVYNSYKETAAAAYCQPVNN